MMSRKLSQGRVFGGKLARAVRANFFVRPP